MTSDSDIIAKIAERLVAAPTAAGDRVFEARFLPVQPQDMPCINIVPGPGNYTMDDGETHNVVDQQFTLIVYVKGDEQGEIQSGADSVYTTLENIKNSIFTEFNNIYENLDKLTYRFKIVNSRVELKPEADWIYGLLFMTYSAILHERVVDPHRP